MLSVDVELSAGRQMINQIGDRLDGHAGGVHNLLGDILEEYEKDLFASNGRSQWAALDRATVKAKGNGRVLVDTGGLMRLMTHPERTSDGARVSAGWPYGNLKKGARGMPKRDPAPLPSRRTIDQWAERVLGFLIDGTAR